MEPIEVMQLILVGLSALREGAAVLEQVARLIATAQAEGRKVTSEEIAALRVDRLAALSDLAAAIQRAAGGVPK